MASSQSAGPADGDGGNIEVRRDEAKGNIRSRDFQPNPDAPLAVEADA